MSDHCSDCFRPNPRARNWTTIPGLPDVETDWIDWASFSYPFNLTRQPAVSVPCGFTRPGLPVGLQIVGPL